MDLVNDKHIPHVGCCAKSEYQSSQSDIKVFVRVLIYTYKVYTVCPTVFLYHRSPVEGEAGGSIPRLRYIFFRLKQQITDINGEISGEKWTW